MLDEPTRTQRERVLDPVDRMSEILFGLIMVLTFTCTLSVSAHEAEIRELIIAAIGCNAAWGLVDGVMFVVMGSVERAHDARAAGEEIETGLTSADWLAGGAVTLLVFGSTFPVVLPFFFFDDATTALRISNGIALVMLFACGHVLGRHAGIRPLRTGIIMTVLGVVLVTVTIALGGWTRHSARAVGLAASLLLTGRCDCRTLSPVWGARGWPRGGVMRGSWLRAAVAVVAVTVATVAGSAGVAQAVFAVSSSVNFPTPVSVGQTDVPASFTLDNDNSGSSSTASNEVCNFGDVSFWCVGAQGITFVPACKATFSFGCMQAQEEDGVFSLSTTATTQGSCGGVMTLDIADLGGGRYRFTPQGGGHILIPPGGSCTVDFTFDVLKLPFDVNLSTPGAQTYQVVTSEHVPDDGFEGSPLYSVATDETTVLAVPSISTTATPSTLLGGQISDTATVTGHVDPQPGATVEFRVYGPNDATCANAPVFTSSVAQPISNSAVQSGAFTPSAGGTYRWRAFYGGDAANAAVSGPCNAPNETSNVIANSPVLATSASADVVIGGQVSDTATVTGRSSPQLGAMVTFTLYGPDDVECARPPVFTSVASLPTDVNTVSSGAFTPTTPGLYRWRASYSGDAFNLGVSAPCNAANESVYVTQKPTTISTTASPGIVVGAGAVSDSAVVLGRGNPISAATVSFRLFGPDDPTCTRPVFESPEIPYPIAGGAVTSPSFTPTMAGTYRWRATYSGDISNAPAADLCDAETERVVVAKATPTINTSAGPDIILGGDLTNNAVVGGLVNPQQTGAVNIVLFGPLLNGTGILGEEACAGTPVFQMQGVPYFVAGRLVSATFKPKAVGVYGWRAVYTGDANNFGVTSQCDTVNVRVLPIPDLASGALPETGRDTSGMLAIAFGTTAAGAAMLFVGLRRRRHRLA